LLEIEYSNLHWLIFSLEGLPEEFQKLLDQMMTKAELDDPSNKTKAMDIINW
jgi:hypothetical protein